MIYAMSDIHGCVKELKNQMEQINLEGNDHIIFLGDYIDYGPCSGDVLRYIYDLQLEYGQDKVIVLKGNHEALLIEWIDEFSKGPGIDSETLTYDSWLKNDSENGYNTFRTLVSEEQFKEITEMEQAASFSKLNKRAVGTSYIAEDNSFHEIFYDGKSHYYIDGSVYGNGKLLVLGYNEEDGQYYQVENGELASIRKKKGIKSLEGPNGRRNAKQGGR